MFSVMSICLFTRGGSHVITTHDAIGQLQVTWQGLPGLDNAPPDLFTPVRYVAHTSAGMRPVDFLVCKWNSFCVLKVET